MLKKENVFLNEDFKNYNEVIEFIGDVFYKQGYTDEKYTEGMKLKEKEFCTNIGNGVAIPHGTNDSKKYIKKSGIVVVILKDGVQWGNEKAYLVIGIAGVEDEHIEILSNIAVKIADKSVVDKIVENGNQEDIYKFLVN